MNSFIELLSSIGLSLVSETSHRSFPKETNDRLDRRETQPAAIPDLIDETDESNPHENTTHHEPHRVAVFPRTSFNKNGK